MVNGADSVYVERFGRLQPTDVTFRDDEHVMQILERMLANIGRSIDYSNPMADSRLPDGSRVNAIIPPASIHGPMITIRKFVADRLTAEDLVAIGSLNQAATVVLDAAVSSGAGIVVSGGTGTGKTTLLNVLSGWIPDGERIVTIEDPAELALRQPHVVSLEARAEQNGVEVTRAQLLKNALRMRPDRIIIGEVRGAEAFDMLQAMNTGHDGSMTTVHANSPRDALRRIEQMVMMAGYDWPLRAIREQVSSAIDIVIQVGRLRDGSRRIVDISEVHGMEGDTISMQQLYVFEHRGTDDEGRILGELVPTGLRPRTFDLPGTEDFEDRYDDQIATEVTPIR
jgi:pilus assembly protein CpaF